MYGRNQYSNGHDYSDAEQYDCVEFGGGNQCPDALYQHGHHEHHLFHDHGNGGNGDGSTNGGNGQLELERGDHYGYALGIGDLHLYGDDDGWLYGWRQYSNRQHHGDSRYGGWIRLIGTNSLH